MTTQKEKENQLYFYLLEAGYSPAEITEKIRDGEYDDDDEYDDADADDDEYDDADADDEYDNDDADDDDVPDATAAHEEKCYRMGPGKHQPPWWTEY